METSKFREIKKIFWALPKYLRWITIDYVSNTLYGYCNGAKYTQSVLLQYNWDIPEIAALSDIPFSVVFAEYYDAKAERDIRNICTMIGLGFCEERSMYEMRMDYIRKVYNSLLWSPDPASKYARLCDIHAGHKKYPLVSSNPDSAEISEVFGRRLSMLRHETIRTRDLPHLIYAKQTGLFVRPHIDWYDIVSAMESPDNIETFRTTVQLYACHGELASKFSTWVKEHIFFHKEMNLSPVRNPPCGREGASGEHPPCGEHSPLKHRGGFGGVIPQMGASGENPPCGENPPLEKFQILAEFICDPCYFVFLKWLLMIYNSDSVRISRAITYRKGINYTDFYKSCLEYGTIINWRVFRKILAECPGSVIVDEGQVAAHLAGGSRRYLLKAVRVGKSVYAMSKGLRKRLRRSL